MNKKIIRFATTTIICVLVASIFGTVMVLAPAPELIFPQLIDVFVTNTSSDPVPVDVTDSTLDVTLDEPIDVTLDEPIDVTLDEPIEVINTPDFEPVQFQGILLISDGTLYDEVIPFFEVPEGKMLVIEYISAAAEDIDVSDSLSVSVATTVNGEGALHYLGLVEPQGRSKQFLSKEVKFYADPETFVSVKVFRLTGLNDVAVYVRMSGYFIDVS